METQRFVWTGQALASALLALSVAAGCSREPPDLREVRLAAQRYVNALASKDLPEIRARSTCVVSPQSIRGGNVLRIGDLRRITLATLDSLSTAAADAHRVADSLWTHGGNQDHDALFAQARRAGRVHIVYRNAIRASTLSDPDSFHDSRTPVESRSIRVRIRYAGPVVGPEPVDREVMLRLLRVPAGKWIAFSLYTVEDDPKPDGV